MRKNFKDKRCSCKVCYPHKRGFVSRWKPRDMLELRQWEHDKHEWLHGALPHEMYPYPPKSYDEWPGAPDDSGRWVFGGDGDDAC